MDGLTRRAVDRIVARVARALRAAKSGEQPSRQVERLADHGVWEHMVTVSAFDFIRAHPCACSSAAAEVVEVMQDFDDFEADADNPLEQGYAVLAPIHPDTENDFEDI